MPTLSRAVITHLAKLKDAGLIRVWRDNSFDVFPDATGHIYFCACDPQGDLLISPISGRLTDDQAYLIDPTI